MAEEHPVLSRENYFSRRERGAARHIFCSLYTNLSRGGTSLLVLEIPMTETPKVPSCIGIILDGNRRWAKENGLPAFEGHLRGMNNVESIAYAARDLGIRHMAVYAFSTENWNRSKEEVSYLMEIFESTIRERMKKFAQENIAVRFVGQIERFSPPLQGAMRDVEAKNPREPRLTVWVCISSGRKAEIVHAAEAVQKANGTMTEESLAKHLWTA